MDRLTLFGLFAVTAMLICYTFVIDKTAKDQIDGVRFVRAIPILDSAFESKEMHSTQSRARFTDSHWWFCNSDCAGR